MPQVNTFTTLEITSGPVINQTVFYLNEDLGAILLAFITGQGVTSVSGYVVEQGYGVVVLDTDFTGNVSVSLDPVTGDLLITGPTDEIYKYAIDTDGNLTYTTTV